MKVIRTNISTIIPLHPTGIGLRPKGERAVRHYVALNGLKHSEWLSTVCFYADEHNSNLFGKLHGFSSGQSKYSGYTVHRYGVFVVNLKHSLKLEAIVTQGLATMQRDVVDKVYHQLMSFRD